MLLTSVGSSDILSQKQQLTLTESQSEKQGLFAKLFGSKKKDALNDHSIPSLVKHPSLVKQRKAPIKVEPKVFFANERTFLAWMHIAIILAGASIAILAFSDGNQNASSQIYGIIMLPVAVAFIVYAMYQCKFKVDVLQFLIYFEFGNVRLISWLCYCSQM
jgi:hypothetical protein